jgi:hypothetical protein
MSVQHANRGVVKKDLQLYYNREFQKSFRGEATSNLVMNPNDSNYYQGLYQTIITPNAAIAPDGSNNAWSLAWNGTATTYNYYSKNFPIVSSTVYTTSVFAKAGTHDVIWMGISNMSGGENAASFNLTTGVATNASPASASFSMVYYGGGWWRCITTNTSGVTGATASAMTVSVGSNRATLGTVYFWGFQAERKSYVTTFLDSLNPIRNQVATNLYSADPYDGLDFVTTYNYQGSTGASFSAVTGITNPINAPTVIQYNTGTSGYQYFALTKTGLASGTYTVSYYARLASGGPSALNNGQLWRDTSTDRTPDGDFNPTIYTYWRRFRATALVTTGRLDFFPLHSGSLTGGFTVYFTGFQLELGNEPTSFSPTTISTANTIASNGGLLDISGNNVNADLTNVSFNSTGYYLAGTASANRIQFTTPTSFIYSAAGKTVLMWIKYTGSGYFGFCGLGNAANGQSFNLRTSNTYLGFMGYNADYDPSAGPQLNNDVWHLIGATFDAYGVGTLKLYVDGSNTASATLTLNTGPEASNIGYIGRSSHGSGNEGYFGGQVGQFMMYNRPLSADEILQIFNSQRKTYGI